MVCWACPRTQHPGWRASFFGLFCQNQIAGEEAVAAAGGFGPRPLTLSKKAAAQWLRFLFLPLFFPRPLRSFVFFRAAFFLSRSLIPQSLPEPHAWRCPPRRTTSWRGSCRSSRPPCRARGRAFEPSSLGANGPSWLGAVGGGGGGGGRVHLKDLACALGFLDAQAVDQEINEQISLDQFGADLQLPAAGRLLKADLGPFLLRRRRLGRRRSHPRVLSRQGLAHRQAVQRLEGGAGLVPPQINLLGNHEVF